ncbi:MAG: class I SAM-dependent methyltransferase [Dehalococcoidia bacterium]|nr:MAG: class I SAM-dependent methyltransferase [Dehalococcoidia bacterium]
MFQEFHDPRLVAVYDAWGDRRLDTAFYLGLAAELSVTAIVDIGCGTGEITCALALQGHRVTGVDPAPAMLQVARHRPGGELVRWIEGDASSLEGQPADLAIMTAHVAQVIHHQDAWRATLTAAHRALRPGGHLAFESRNPDARAWLAWTPEASRQRLDTPVGVVDVWFDLTEVVGDLVRYDIHYGFASGSEELVSSNALRIRSQAGLERSLTDAGFEVRHVFGDWERSPVGPDSPELIFVATRS